MKWFNLIFILLIVSCYAIKEVTLIEPPYVSERYLIITADDFGASKNINEGIQIAADYEIITAISALTNFGESLAELKQLSVDHPAIGIGVHLNITTGKPVLSTQEIPTLIGSTGNFYTLEELLPFVKSISLDDLRRELRAQIVALTILNIKLDHLSDQSGILSLYGPFFDIILELGKEFNVPVRSNYISSVKYPLLFPDSCMKRHGNRIAFKFWLKNPIKAINMLKYSGRREMAAKSQRMDNQGVSHPDMLIEYFWGDPTQGNYRYILKHLPIGISELVLHVGSVSRQNTYPSGLDQRYFSNREKELDTVTADDLKDYFNYKKIKTITYSDIAKFKVQK